MALKKDIQAVHDRTGLTDDDRRRQLYGLKTAALVDVISKGAPRTTPKIKPLLGRVIKHAGFSFRINSARVTEHLSLELDVTFTRAPAASVTHQITIVNPPVLPRARTGSEKKDLIKAISEMLEGFV